MELEFCMTCDCENNFRLIKDYARTIRVELNEIIEFNSINVDSVELNSDYYEVFNNMVLENKHLDVPCGVCHKVDINELTLLEDDIKGMLSKIIIYVFRGDWSNSIKINVADSLMKLFKGHYPGLYNLIGCELCE